MICLASLPACVCLYYWQLLGQLNETLAFVHLCILPPISPSVRPSVHSSASAEICPHFDLIVVFSLSLKGKLWYFLTCFLFWESATAFSNHYCGLSAAVRFWLVDDQVQECSWVSFFFTWQAHCDYKTPGNYCQHIISCSSVASCLLGLEFIAGSQGTCFFC